MPFSLFLAFHPTHLSLRKVCGLFVFILALSLIPPAHAGQWLFTYSGDPAVTQNPTRSPFPWKPPVTPVSSVSVSYQTGTFPNSSGASTTSEAVKCPIQVTIAWSPSGTLANDPQPSFIRLTESGTATWSASGYYDQTTISGTGAATIANVPVSTVQYSTVPTLNRPVTESANLTLSPPPNASAGGNVGNTFSYSVQAVSVSPSLTIDQDQQILAPAATTRFSATISNASGFTIDSVKISVDGTPTAATVNPNSPNNYYIDWPQSGGNPSEHTVTATAKIHDSVGALSLNSTDLPNRQYATCGMGRPADDIIADVHLQSIKFNSNIPLSQDAVTPVPSPEFTWTAGGTSAATANSAAYVQGKNVNLTLLLGSSAGAALTGSATMGYLCKLQASPNTTNPATNAADPVLTLYDNTTANPTVPASCSASTTVAATTALSSWVSVYTTSFPVLTFYVEFTKIPTPTWSVLSSYNSYVGNTVYATVATPTAPMATPWVGVLADACNWAKRTTSATSATTALTTGEYNNCTYNGGNFAHTPNYLQDGTETFHLRGMLGDLTGQCNDFSDFLACLSNAIGARPIKPQRSVSAAEQSAGSHFYTKPVTAAPQQTSANAAPVSGGWSYHQWANDSTIFDGSLRFGGTTTPVDITGPAFGSTYNTDLVASYLHLFTPPALPVADWDPQTSISLNVVN